MPIRTTKYEAADLRHLLTEIERLRETLVRAVAWTEKNGSDLYVFNASSQRDAMKRLTGFERELFSSVAAAESGRPFSEDTLKSRARADDAMINKGSSELAAESKKRSAKKSSQGKSTGRRTKGSGS